MEDTANKWPFCLNCKINGTPLLDLIGTPALTHEEWEEIKQRVINAEQISLNYADAHHSKARLMCQPK